MVEVTVNVSPYIHNLSNMENQFNNRYNSNGEIGPFKDIEELEEHQMCNEEDVPVGKPCTEPTKNVINDVNGNFVDIAENILIPMKRDDLKEKL